jgi:hypothetical protein
MRKVNAMVGIATACLMLVACQSLELTPSVPHVSSSVIQTPTPRPTPTPTWNLPPQLLTVAPTATIAPPLRFTVVAKPTQQPVSSAAPEYQPTPSPVPTWRFTAAITVPLPCDSRPGVAWRTWQLADVAHQPVLALLAERGTLWVSTWSGVFQVDPRTGVFTRTLGFEVVAGVSQLFPLGEGHLWASTDHGDFFYDGQGWSSLPISGPASPLYVIGIDQNGDLQTFSQKLGGTRSYYRLPGHFPPPGNDLWTAMPISDVMAQANTCEWQSAVRDWRFLGLPYRSPQECRAVKKAYQVVEETIPDYGRTVLDATGSIWWLSDRQSYNQSLTLENIDGDQIVAFELPSRLVTSIAPDPQHGIWLGTEHGLLYSDGKDLRLVLAGLDACVGPPIIQEIAIDPQGTVWALAFGQAYVLPPGTVEWQDVPDPTGTEERIESITAAVKGGIWATHGDDLFHFGGPEVMLPIQLPEKCRVNKLTEKAGSVWASGTDCGLLQFDMANATWILHRSLRASAEHIDVGTDGTLYALGTGPAGMGLYAYTNSQPGDSGAPIHQWVRVADVPASVMAYDRAKGIWLASSDPDRFWYYTSGQLTPYGEHLNGPTLLYLNADGQTLRRISLPLWVIDGMTSGPDGRIWVTGRNSQAASHYNIAVYDPAADKQP